MSVVAIRTVVLYIAIVFAQRVMGKRQMGELQPAEFVVTILISNLATLSIEDSNIPLLGCLLPIFMLVSCEVIVSVLSLKSPLARKLVSGNPRVVVRDGVIDQREMKNLRWSIDDLTEQLRQAGCFDIREVSFAIVETSGGLSVYQKFPARTVTAEMLDLQPGGMPDAPPMTVISDGIVDEDALSFLNLRREWLNRVLAKQKLTPSDVFLMTCDRQAKYAITVKEGKRA